MRSLFLLLLFINALAWVYQRWIIVPDEPRPALSVEQDFPRLNALPRPAAAAAAAPEPPASGAARCIRIGPVEQAANADGIVARLRNRGIAVSAEEEQSRLWVGHWVQIVGLEDRDAAEASRNRLIAAGLADAYIVTGGEELKISLGVFKSDASRPADYRPGPRPGFQDPHGGALPGGHGLVAGCQAPRGRRVAAG